MSTSTLLAQSTGANPFSFSVNAASLVVANNNATLTLSGAHGMLKGWGIVVQGASEPHANGAFEVSEVVSSTVLRYEMSSDPPYSGTPTGTITLRRWLRSSDFGAPLLLDPASGALLVKTV